MTVQDIKRGHFKTVEGDGLRTLLEDHFGTDVKVAEDGWHYVNYGALAPLGVRILSKSELEISTRSAPDVEPEAAQETIRRYNRFLEAATGFNSKQRSKRLQAKAKKGTL